MNNIIYKFTVYSIKFYLLIFLSILISFELYGQTTILSHENLKLGMTKDEVLSRIEVKSLSIESEGEYGYEYTLISDNAYYEIGGIKFNRRLRLDSDILTEIKLSKIYLETSKEEDAQEYSKKLSNLFLLKGKKLTNNEPIYENTILENQMQIADIQFVGQKYEDIVKQCHFDAKKTKRETYKFILDNAQFIYEFDSSPCFGDDLDGFISNFKVYYQINRLYIFEEEQRKIKKSKF